MATAGSHRFDAETAEKFSGTVALPIDAVARSAMGGVMRQYRNSAAFRILEKNPSLLPAISVGGILAEQIREWEKKTALIGKTFRHAETIQAAARMQELANGPIPTATAIGSLPQFATIRASLLKNTEAYDRIAKGLRPTVIRDLGQALPAIRAIQTGILDEAAVETVPDECIEDAAQLLDAEPDEELEAAKQLAISREAMEITTELIGGIERDGIDTKEGSSWDQWELTNGSRVLLAVAYAIFHQIDNPVTHGAASFIGILVAMDFLHRWSE